MAIRYNMDEFMGYIIFGGLIVLFVFLRIIAKIQENKISIIQKELELKNVNERYEQLQDDFEQKYEDFKKTSQQYLEKLINQSSIGYPFLAEAISDYYENQDLIFSEYLRTKKRPAIKQAEKIKLIGKEKRIFKKEFLTSKYLLNYYEKLFPWLIEYVGYEALDIIKNLDKEETVDEEDPVLKYVPKGEYEQLTTTQRNQKALDRYWQSRKDKWIIGRDYERYIGYIYEIDGFKVKYQGILEGREDMGRDLICEDSGTIHVIQCKYWSKDKIIHENHINQLFGTTIKFILDNLPIKNRSEVFDLLASEKVVARMVTSTSLSETAKKFADSLGIQYWEGAEMDFNYPCIKCNVSRQSSEKIYHLPFDQQYDKVLIEPEKGEFYCSTVKEAEDSGFRRAWRWRPNAT